MGFDKASMLVDGRTSVARVVEALSAVADPVLEVGPGRSGLPAVREEPAGAGPLVAIAAGWRALRGRGHAGPVLVLACDLPLVDAAVTRLLARGVTALDMETAGVGAVCDERGVPWTAFRAVSDRPDDGLVDGSVFSLLNEDGTTDVGAGIRYALFHPGRLPGLVRLARDSARGCGLAARAAVEALPGA